MEEFKRKFGGQITGILSGFDRLVFRGTLRCLAYVGGVVGLMLSRNVKFIDYGAFVERQTAALVRASLTEALEQGRPVRYLASSRVSKEKIAEQIAQEDGIKEGLVCVLKCVEPCCTYELRRDRERQKASIAFCQRKCTFLYHYWIDPNFGMMSARIQTWLPYPVQVCLNGREWLARQMDRHGIAYQREDNAFSWIQDVAAAQALMDSQLKTDWPGTLSAIARRLNPVHDALVGAKASYYWSTYQSEWATDVMFGSGEALDKLFPKLIRGAILGFGAEQVMRYLRDMPLLPTYEQRIVSDLRRREEGVRVRHWAGENSIKAYDKPRILRVETTINDASAFKTYRPTEGHSEGKKAWRQMRRGVADLHRRAEVSHAANARYLDALASLEVDETVGELVEPACHPTRWRGQRVRALRPWSPEDQTLLAAIADGGGVVNGFRNRDLRAKLHPGHPSPDAARRLGARITRQLRLLRAHGLIHKVPKTHRYILTSKGRKLTTAILQAKAISVKALTELAA